MATIHSLPKELFPFLTVDISIDDLMSFFLTCKTFCSLYPKEVNVFCEVWDGDRCSEDFEARVTVCFGDGRPDIADDFAGYAIFDDWKVCYTCWFGKVNTNTMIKNGTKDMVIKIIDDDEKRVPLTKHSRIKYDDGTSEYFALVCNNTDGLRMNERYRGCWCVVKEAKVGRMISFEPSLPTQTEIDIAFATNMAINTFVTEPVPDVPPRIDSLTAIYDNNKRFQCCMIFGECQIPWAIMTTHLKLYFIELNTCFDTDMIDLDDSWTYTHMNRLGELVLQGL